MIPQDKDDVVFTKTSNTGNSTVAPADEVLQLSSNEDEESGRIAESRIEEKTWSRRRIYNRYKILFHIGIWAVWTT